MKYALYQTETGLRAVEYADTKEAIKQLPYIKESYLPVIINAMRGYTSFTPEYEKSRGFLKIIEVNKGTAPLTREQMYPKNAKLFVYGWIAPNGDTYATEYKEHYNSAVALCKELHLKTYNAERTLEELGWVKITGSMMDGTLKKAIYVNNFYITKKQADALFDLGLWEVGNVPAMLYKSEPMW